MPRDEPLRFFVDETSLGVARALAMVRGDVVYPGHRRLPKVPEGTKDPDWMPVIAGLGLVVISRDRHIKSKAAELEAYRALGLRAFWIAGDRDLGNWENLTRLVKWWPTVERLIDAKGAGPWFYALNLTSVTEIGIKPPRPTRGMSTRPSPPARRRPPDQLDLDLPW
jgi:hypothetical protein